jgi:hypothetical protein
MSSDTRRYEQRQWDALLATELGLLANPNRFLAARQAAGTVTVAAPGAGIHNLIAQVQVSFFGTPSGTSTVTVQSGAGTTVFQAFLTAGNNTFNFSPPLLAPQDTAMLVGINPGGGTAITNVLAGTIVPYPYRVQ